MKLWNKGEPQTICLGFDSWDMIPKIQVNVKHESLNQTKMFLQSKKQNQKDKKETYRMGENIEKPHMQ